MSKVEKVELGGATTEECRKALEKIAKELTGPKRVGDREANQIWVAWNLLNAFAQGRKDEPLYQMLKNVADLLETIPGLGGD